MPHAQSTKVARALAHRCADALRAQEQQRLGVVLDPADLREALAAHSASAFAAGAHFSDELMFACNS